VKMKFGYLLIGAVILAFGSCVAKSPEKPATIIQMPQSAPEADIAVIDDAQEVSSAPEVQDDGQLRTYQEYSADYLAALASTGDMAEAEWNTFLRCRAASIAQTAQIAAEQNNTGLEAELQKRLRAVVKDAKARAVGKRFYSHDAKGAADFRDPATDTIVLVMLLQTMQDSNPSFPMCTQNAGSLWREAERILNAADEMARTDPQSVPVRVPKEVANEPD